MSDLLSFVNYIFIQYPCDFKPFNFSDLVFLNFCLWKISHNMQNHNSIPFADMMLSHLDNFIFNF